MLLECELESDVPHRDNGICTTSDANLLRTVLDACENFTPINEDDREALIEKVAGIQPLFA